MSNSVSTIESTLRDQVLAEEAYKRAQAKIEAVDAAKVLPINLDITAATATVLGAMGGVIAYRQQVEAEVPRFPVTLFDDIETFAYALLYVNSVYQVSVEPKDELQPLLEQATQKLTVLQADASALAKRGLIPAEILGELSPDRGYKAAAANLQLVYTALDTHWEKIVGKCAVDRAELDLAGRLAARIVRLVGLREQSPSAVADATLTRARAYTLFVNAWDEIRRAIGYVRWQQGDADEIAPSLYANRGKRRPEQPEKPATPPVAPAPTEPSNGTPPVIRNLNIPGGSPFVQ